MTRKKLVKEQELKDFTNQWFRHSFYAALFSVTEDWIAEMAKKGIIPKGRKGTNGHELEFLPTVTTYLSYIRKSKRGADVDLKKRLTLAQVVKIELENAIKKNEVFKKEVILKLWTGSLLNIKAKIQGVCSVIAQDLVYEDDPRMAEKKVRKELDRVLDELSSFDGKLYSSEILLVENE